MSLRSKFSVETDRNWQKKMRAAQENFFRCVHSYVIRPEQSSIFGNTFAQNNHLDSEILFQSEFGQKTRVCSKYMISERQPFIDPCLQIKAYLVFHHRIHQCFNTCTNLRGRPYYSWKNYLCHLHWSSNCRNYRTVSSNI